MPKNGFYEKKEQAHVGRLGLFAGVVFFLFLILAPDAGARQIPADAAIRILIAEAADQGFKGMLCVGEVLRRRGSTKGFYGYKSNMAKRQPKSIWRLAARAWQQSAYSNHTQGADHFENVRGFGEPWWAKYCVKVYEYKDHVFYKKTRLAQK